MAELLCLARFLLVVYPDLNQHAVDPLATVTLAIEVSSPSPGLALPSSDTASLHLTSLDPFPFRRRSSRSWSQASCD